MAKSQTELFDFLSGLGIETRTVAHPPLFTVAESKALRGQLAGGHTKNLFLKDRKDNFFLLTVEEDAMVDLKTIHHAIGAAGKVSFGSPDRLMALLGVVPGAVTALGLINDAEHRVRFFLDRGLLSHVLVNVHPLTNEATTTVKVTDLLRFARETGHEPSMLDLAPS